MIFTFLFSLLLAVFVYCWTRHMAKTALVNSAIHARQWYGRPQHFAWYAVIVMFTLLEGFFIGGYFLDAESRLSVAEQAVIASGFALVSLIITRRVIRPDFSARQRVEKVGVNLLFLCALASVLITAAIALSVLFEALRFFQQVSLGDFLLGLQWSPQGEGAFGAVPVFTGTLLITVIAMLVAVPLGLFCAIYMVEYARPRLRSWAKPTLELLAGIPTVVYGYFAITSLAPMLRSLGHTMGLDIASESALTAGLVMGVMIIPLVSSLSDDIIAAVPQALRDASYALGATRSETIRHVVFPAALPGIMGAVMLAISRAIGETMIVVMAAGLSANLTANPLQSVTTVTAQIVSLLSGDQEFNSPKTLAAFALGLSLFFFTLLLNIIALAIVKKYREAYE
ncbi:MAG: phosphate ABC transporter permease subunit PstC [Rickettsiales bacterium]|nr:phosphate ABC transporter permease subunit PstC [Rickettsiales bacterium]